MLYRDIYFTIYPQFKPIYCNHILIIVTRFQIYFKLPNLHLTISANNNYSSVSKINNIIKKNSFKCKKNLKYYP